ncbi:MAG TPA: DUF6569 family protein, partial [Pyrinomonadaceae bacterium]|nr:DUF6569 family protein [Pyrinomonadaceae bacterium]
MTSLPLRRRALATLCASLLVVASATTAPLFVTAPARAHGPKLNGPQPDRRPFRVGRPVSDQNLSLFPVHGRVAPPPTNDYVTLDEGLRAGTVVITERGGERRMVRRRGGRRGARRVQVRSEESGDDSVNELALINRS